MGLKDQKIEKKNFFPLSLTVFVVALDQLTKAWIVKHVPMHGFGSAYFGDFFRIIHVRNKGVAWSIGANLPSILRIVLFTVVALAFLVILGFFMVKSKDFIMSQRWFLGGIIGGGLGNILDRIFRPDGVVDFIDVKFYGIFGMSRFPTFNVADSFITVCAILLIISMFTEERKNRKAKSKNTK